MPEGLNGAPAVVKGVDHEDGNSAIDIVSNRLDIARGLINALANTFEGPDCKCAIPDERLREALDGSQVIVGEARAAMSFVIFNHKGNVSAAIIER